MPKLTFISSYLPEQIHPGCGHDVSTVVEDHVDQPFVGRIQQIHRHRGLGGEHHNGPMAVHRLSRLLFCLLGSLFGPLLRSAFALGLISFLIIGVGLGRRLRLHHCRRHCRHTGLSRNHRVDGNAVEVLRYIRMYQSVAIGLGYHRHRLTHILMMNRSKTFLNRVKHVRMNWSEGHRYRVHVVD